LRQAKERTMTPLTVVPVRDDIRFGARVGGVTRAALADPSVRAELRRRFDEYGLLIFEGVEPSPAMQVAISTVFGPLKDHPSQAVARAGGDEMLGVIEMRHEANGPGKVRLNGRLLSSWLPWHFDHCYNDQLNRAGVLRCVEGPNDSGLTGFVDGIALYDAISPEARALIEDETVVYAMDVILENLRYGRPDDFVEVDPAEQSDAVMAEFAGRPRALHPAVWTRPTGEKVLHVSPWMAKGLAGRDDADADARLDAVCDEIVAAAEQLCYFHRWQPTDMVIWDNWRVLHAVSGMPADQTRCMHRTTIEGDYGLGRFETAPVA
jgi:taurine dioxygenase